MNLIIDLYDCKDAFKVFDPENTGTIIKDVSTFLKLFFQNQLKPLILISLDCFLYGIPAVILRIFQREVFK